MAFNVICRKCGQTFSAQNGTNLSRCVCPNCQSLSLVRDHSEEESIRNTGSIIGGAILGASLGGLPGAIIGGIVGIALAGAKNESVRKGGNNG